MTFGLARKLTIALLLVGSATLPTPSGASPKPKERLRPAARGFIPGFREWAAGRHVFRAGVRGKRPGGTSVSRKKITVLRDGQPKQVPVSDVVKWVSAEKAAANTRALSRAAQEGHAVSVGLPALIRDLVETPPAEPEDLAEHNTYTLAAKVKGTLRNIKWVSEQTGGGINEVVFTLHKVPAFVIKQLRPQIERELGGGVAVRILSSGDGTEHAQGRYKGPLREALARTGHDWLAGIEVYGNRSNTKGAMMASVNAVANPENGLIFADTDGNQPREFLLALARAAVSNDGNVLGAGALERLATDKEGLPTGFGGRIRRILSGPAFESLLGAVEKELARASKRPARLVSERGGKGGDVAELTRARDALLVINEISYFNAGEQFIGRHVRPNDDFAKSIMVENLLNRQGGELVVGKQGAEYINVKPAGLYETYPTNDDRVVDMVGQIAPAFVLAIEALAPDLSRQAQERVVANMLTDFQPTAERHAQVYHERVLGISKRARQAGKLPRDHILPGTQNRDKFLSGKYYEALRAAVVAWASDNLHEGDLAVPAPSKMAPGALEALRGALDPDLREPARAGPTHEEISLRAYYIGQNRQATEAPGNQDTDWEQAEKELRGGGSGN